VVSDPDTGEVLRDTVDVVRGLPFDPPITGIVVGYDGSFSADEALRWALAEAALRDCPLHVVHAWSLLSSAGLVDVPFGTVPGLPECAVAVRAALGEAVTRIQTGPVPAVVQLHVVHERPAAALIAASHGADLLVVGERGHDGFLGLLVGSVAEQVMRHAVCPVVVVRGRALAGPPGSPS
jgi:nucleotide-binding universal stress UspA family protein